MIRERFLCVYLVWLQIDDVHETRLVVKVQKDSNLVEVGGHLEPPNAEKRGKLVNKIHGTQRHGSTDHKHRLKLWIALRFTSTITVRTVTVLHCSLP